MLSISLKASMKDGYTVENTSRELAWNADEPKEIGGNNTGPTPTELLLSSLASCKLITMRMYAQRKEWDLESASVNLTITVQDDNKTQIEKSIQLQDDLTEDQKSRLIAISGRCPVVKMLADSVQFMLV
ncbi:MAG: OsmC family protein [Crocinitomicaceae bacterium]|nr:OsmC family protein [Crocinitomicaceae bacterium]